MTKKSFQVYECERCGHQEAITEQRQAYPWGRVGAAQENGPAKIGEPSRAADVCPSCMDAMIAWWRAGKLPDGEHQRLGADVPCPNCRCRSFARCDELKGNGHFGPGPLVRCVECKAVYYQPERAE